MRWRTPRRRPDMRTRWLHGSNRLPAAAAEPAAAAAARARGPGTPRKARLERHGGVLLRKVAHRRLKPHVLYQRQRRHAGPYQQQRPRDVMLVSRRQPGSRVRCPGGDLRLEGRHGGVARIGSCRACLHARPGVLQLLGGCHRPAGGRATPRALPQHARHLDGQPWGRLRGGLRHTVRARQGRGMALCCVALRVLGVARTQASRATGHVRSTAFPPTDSASSGMRLPQRLRPHRGPSPAVHLLRAQPCLHTARCAAWLLPFPSNPPARPSSRPRRSTAASTKPPSRRAKEASCAATGTSTSCCCT